MYRDKAEVRSEHGINFLLTHCALGDGIASLPAIAWARDNHHIDMRMTVWAPKHMLELFEHLLGRPGLSFMPLDQFQMVRKKGDDKLAGACVINTVQSNTVTRNRFDMVDYAFATLLDRQPDTMQEKNYLYTASLGVRPHEAPYVVLPVGATNDTCVFRSDLLRSVIEWLLANDYKPVLTGNHNTHVHTTEPQPKLLVVKDKVSELPSDIVTACLDLRNTLDLMQLRDWCGHAAAVVGVDGGTLHLAGTTEVPIVYGMTRVAPRHRSIVRHDVFNWNLIHVEPRDLECSGCQSNWTLIFGHDFAKCFYGDAKCVDLLHPDDFIEAMKQLGL